jgi:hypothetical protein
MSYGIWCEGCGVLVANLGDPCRWEVGESPLGGDFLHVSSSSHAVFLLERKRVTFVPHSGQVPWAILLPFAASLTVAFLTVWVLRHLTQ